MIDIENYMQQIIGLLKLQFGSRLVYVGLQGSYLRGEATRSSDIDIMVVIDQLMVSDLVQYRSVIQSTEYFDKSCGFICSKTDLAHWNPLEICNLLHGTKDYFGALHELIPAYTEQDIRNFVKLSVNNMCHALCHSYIHSESNTDIAGLSGTYKGVFFILQNLYYLTQGRFVSTKAELVTLLDGKNRAVLERAIELNIGAPCDFSGSFSLLFTWCQEVLLTI